MYKQRTVVVVLTGLLILASGCAVSERTPTNAVTSHMPVAEHTTYYLEIVTTDIKAASDFYANAYGWRFEPEAPELGNALVAVLPDGSLCGIRAPMNTQESPIVRTYLRVVDIDAAVNRAARLGATIALEPMEIPGRGRIAIFFLGEIQQGLWEI